MRGAIALSADNRTSSLKKVSWEALQNLCQVRLFAAEDAPSLLGTTLQELYQAKEIKFLHAAKPVAESDLPPGFVNFAVRHAGCGGNSSAGMDVQVQWHCPEKFVLRAAWQVAVGSGSLEVIAEQRRELGVPAATYAHLDSIPVSPGEPLETSAEMKETKLTEIPIFSVEDEDELDEGGDATQSPRKGAEKVEPGERPGGLSSGSSSSSSAWAASRVDQGASSSCMSEADPNVAAAAAAAYAVLKAKERGASVDHDLLIKILTNPILIKTLLASKQSMGLQLRDLSRADNEGGDKNSELSRSLGSTSGGPDPFALPVPLGSKSTFPAVESMPDANNIQAWNMSNHFGSTRPFMASRGEDNIYGRADLPGMGVSPSQFFPNRQDIKDLIQQHGMERSRIEVLSRGLTEMDFIGNPKPLSAPERHRPLGMGPFPQLGPGGQHGGASTHVRGDGFSHARFGGDPSQSRFQKPCLYFNTPKGCRRGTSCFYLHTTASEPPYGEQPRTDFFSFQSAKRQKFGVPHRD